MKVKHGVVHTMGFHVRLVDHIKAVPVAKVEELRRVWIMAGADGVHIVPPHDLQIPHHLGDPHRWPENRVAVMPVDAPEFDGLAIEPDHTPINADLPEAQGLCDPLPAAVKKQRIQAGILAAPQPDIRYGETDDIVLCLSSQQFRSGCVQQAIVHSRTCRLFQLHRDISGSIPILQRRMDKVIAQMARIAAQKVYIPENAGGAQFVLILKVGAVAPLEHQHVHAVFTLLQKGGCVKL